MGPAIVITVGVLFLLQENGVAWFGQTWPVLLLVIGGFIFMSQSASTEGHVEATVAPAPPYAPPMQTWNSTAPPPPPPAVATQQPDSEVKP
jgi:hypothetical protein